MKKPLKPIPSDCCGQGCTPCVYERYAHQMEIYKEWLMEKEKAKAKKPEQRQERQAKADQQKS